VSTGEVTPVSAGRPLPPPFLAALAYAVRVCVPPKRWALLMLPCGGAVLFGLLARVVDEDSAFETAASGFNEVTEGLFGLVLPFACLVVGDAVLGAEVRSGTFSLTWLSPASFRTIVIARWLAGWLIASAALVPAMVLATLAAQLPEAAGAIAIATLAGCAGYIALFVLIGVATRRAALWSLGVVLLGERLLGGVLAGIAQLSPQWLTRTAYGGLGPDADELLRDGVPSGWGAVVRLAIITIVLVAISIRRVRNLRLAGSSD
jgi:hypothetical protein